jgi:hypothetical protein
VEPNRIVCSPDPILVEVIHCIRCIGGKVVLQGYDLVNCLLLPKRGLVLLRLHRIQVYGMCLPIQVGAHQHLHFVCIPIQTNRLLSRLV